MPLTMKPSDSDCMAKCMHELKHSGSKERSHEQMVAICLKQCGKSKSDVYVQGYFKPKFKTPNVNCMRDQIAKILTGNPDQDINSALDNAYQFCISESDFKEEITKNLKLYPLLHNISLLLKNQKEDFYILDDAEILSAVSPGVSHRIEPMKTLAEASTSGKKKSTNIEKVGYFNNMLEVEFNSGERYIYFVEPEFYDRFVASDSKGKFLWEELRGHEIGLVWGYATGTGSKMKYTPGGVGASLVPYAKGSAGTPEYEPRLPSEKERALIKKEIQIQLMGKGLKYKELDPDLKRGETLEELRSIFGSQKKLPNIKKKSGLPTAPHERYIDFEVKEDSMDELINWVHKEIGAKGDEAIGIAFAISKARKTKVQKRENKNQIKIKEKELANLKTISLSQDPDIHQKIREKVKEITHLEKEENKKEWEKIWESQVSKFDKYKEASKRYKEHKKGMNQYYKNAIYGTLDFIGIPIKEDYCGTIDDFGVCKKRYELLYDFYHMEDEMERNKLQKTIQKYNINLREDTNLEGVITRAGAFKYGNKIVYKNWDNLLENAIEHPILPVFGSKYTNPHKEENIPHLIGYMDSWNPDYDKKELRGTIHTFEPLESISDLDNPKDIQVSLSMFDDAPEESETQHIIGFRNVAIALNNQIQGRCESVDGYGSCMVNPTEDLMIIDDMNIINDASGLYYCSICKHSHRYDSKKGKEHLKSRDKSKEKGKRKQMMSFLELFFKHMRAAGRKKKDMNIQANNLSQIIIQKPSNNRSSSSERKPSKIITKKDDLQMPKENEKVKEEIAKFIEDFKKEQKTDDNLGVNTGNEVPGHTLKDEFVRTMLDDGWSLPAIEKAWTKYNAQNNPTNAGSVDVSTYGFTKNPPSLSGDFEEKLKSLMEVVEKQTESMKKYEDFFEAKQKETENELKTKYKLPLSDESKELIEKLDFDSLEVLQPIMDAVIKEHPEIMPTNKGADEIADMNTNEILKRLGKDKENLRKVKDDMEKIKNDAIAKMKKQWKQRSEGSE